MKNLKDLLMRLETCKQDEFWVVFLGGKNLDKNIYNNKNFVN
jgi:hypothetical protein